MLFQYPSNTQGLPAHKLQQISRDMEWNQKLTHTHTHTGLLGSGLSEGTGTQERVSTSSLETTRPCSTAGLTTLHPQGSAEDQNLMAHKKQQTSPRAMTKMPPKTPHCAHASGHYKAPYQPLPRHTNPGGPSSHLCYTLCTHTASKTPRF